MSSKGIPLEESEARDFAELFSQKKHFRNPEVSLGYFWVRREDSYVRIESDQTLRRLAELGIHFSPLSPAWCDLFIQKLINQRVFSAEAQNIPSRLETEHTLQSTPDTPRQSAASAETDLGAREADVRASQSLVRDNSASAAGRAFDPA